MSPEGRETASLGFGGNIGDPAAAISEALRRLDTRAETVVKAVSSLYSTPPWGKTDQDEFLNCCALVETSLPPVELLDLCLSIERDMKRVRAERWGPRTIDIDVLTYGAVTLETERLRLPHPYMTARGFVMIPLADIAPDMIVGGCKVSDWANKMDASGIRALRTDPDWWRN